MSFVNDNMLSKLEVLPEVIGTQKFNDIFDADESLLITETEYKHQNLLKMERT